MGSCAPQLLYLWEKNPHYSLYRRLGGPQADLQVVVVNLYPCHKSNPICQVIQYNCLLPPLSHLTCISIKFNLYFANYLASVLSELALYRRQTHVAYTASVCSWLGHFRLFCHFKAQYKIFKKLLLFIVRTVSSCLPLPLDTHSMAILDKLFSLLIV